MAQFFDSPEGRRIAYEQTAGQGVGVVFLGGFRSDMQGTKAVALHEWAQRAGRPFLRMDYSGHGQSSGLFEQGSIGDWCQDAASVIAALTKGPQLLVGSSMGGWIALLLARQMPEKLAGLVGIAAAPDFTENGFWAGFDLDQRDRLMREGRLELPSDYDDGPYVITRRLIEDGRHCLLFNQALSLPMPVRLLQGTADADVPVDWALRLLDHGQGPDIRLVLVKDADHRFSTPACLDLMTATVAEVLETL